MGNPIYQQPGMVGYALTLNGINDHVSIAENPAWNFGTGDFSYGFWVKHNRLTGAQWYYLQSGQMATGIRWTVIAVDGAGGWITPNFTIFSFEVK